MTPEEIMNLNIPLKELITYTEDLKWSLMKMNKQDRVSGQVVEVAFRLSGELKRIYDEEKDYDRISENVRILKTTRSKNRKSNDSKP